MAGVLVLRHLGGQRYEWLPAGATDPMPGLREGALADVAAAAPQHRLVLLAPADEVLLTTATVPIRNPARMRQALPFALEEQVADDLRELHFAAGARDASDQVPAAVIRHDRLQGLIAPLAEAGLVPEAVYAEHDLLPTEPNASVWLIEGSRCMVRHPGQPPLAVEAEDLDELLMLGDPRLTASEGGAHLTVYLGPADRDRLGEGLESLRDELASLELRLLRDGPLGLLAPRAAEGKAINLLQGEYAAKNGTDKLWRPWRNVALLLLVLVVAMLLRDIAALRQLKAEEARLDEAIAATFREAMPGTRLVGTGRVQMERRLAAVRGSAAGGPSAPFLASAEAVSRALGSTAGVTIEAVSYRSGILELKLTVPGVDALDSIERQVEAAGNFEVTIQSANPRGEVVEGRLQVAERAS